jgi:hypothetical protein
MGPNSQPSEIPPTSNAVSALQKQSDEVSRHIKNFNAEKLVMTLRDMSADTGIFPTIMDGGILSFLQPVQIDSFLTFVHENFRDDAAKTIMYSTTVTPLTDEGVGAPMTTYEPGPVLRGVYEEALIFPDVHVFVVCSALGAHFEKGVNIVDNEKIFHESTLDLSAASDIKANFVYMKDVIIRANPDSPEWVQACVKTFTKKALVKWIDNQIGGLENFMGRYGALVRPAAPYYRHDTTPGYM